MTLPASGALSMAQINTELGVGATATMSMDAASLRALAGRPAGSISFSDLWGKSSMQPLTAVGNEAYSSAYTANGRGTVSAQPSVTVSGAFNGFSVVWSFIDNPFGMGLTNPNGNYPSVSYQFARYMEGSAGASLRAVITDGAGRSITVNNIYVTFDFYGS